MPNRYDKLRNGRLLKDKRHSGWNYHIADVNGRLYLCGCAKCPKLSDRHLLCSVLKGRNRGRKSKYDIYFGRNRSDA